MLGSLALHWQARALFCSRLQNIFEFRILGPSKRSELSLHSSMSKIRLLFCGSILALFAAAPAAAEFKPIIDRIELQDGDTFVFLGDSITHQCLYTQYVEDFFYTRFPERRIHFYNSGVGGDRAKDALARFDEDLAKFKPKYVTILLGMNDGSYTDFKQNVFDAYQRDMSTLLDKLAEISAQAIPMTPTMFDARAARMRKGSEPRDTYYNSVLAFYGAWLREQSFGRGLGFVDMYSPLNNLTTDQRKKDANFTLIQDAIHPGPNGQVIMAAAILNDMVKPGQASAINIHRASGDRWQAQARHGKVSDIQSDPLRFSFQAESLPWILPPEASEGYKLTHAGQRFGRELLRVVGLNPGKYSVNVDGQEIGRYAAAQLAQGVPLDESDKNPDTKQALEVALLNKERNDKAVHKLRDQWGALKGKRYQLAAHKDKPDEAEFNEKFDKWLPEFKENIAKFKASADEYENRIYQINKPKAHQYEIRPASGE